MSVQKIYHPWIMNKHSLLHLESFCVKHSTGNPIGKRVSGTFSASKNINKYFCLNFWWIIYFKVILRKNMK